MRFVFVVFVVLAVLAFGIIPAEAQNVSSSGGTTLGGFYCPTKLPCNGADPSFPQPQQLITMATGCVATKVGIVASSQPFDTAAGIDSSGCLTANPEAFPETIAGRTVPHCCITQAPGGSCALYCINYVQ